MSASWFFSLALAATAQGVIVNPQASIQAAPVRNVLNAGTEVRLITSNTISSKDARQGQLIEMTVADDVRVNQLLVIPKGTRGVAQVSRVVERGMFGKAGKLEVRVLYAELGGRRVRLDGRSSEKGENRAGATAVAVVLVGAFGGFVNGQNAVIPAGTMLSGYVYEDLPLKAAQP